MSSPRVELRDGFLRVHFGAGLGHADFHPRWLRHNCDADRHPATGERLVCSSELPEGLAVARAAVDGDRLAVTWAPDGRTSVFGLGWLAEHAYARDRAEPPPPAAAASFELPAGGGPVGESVPRALALVAAQGAAVVRRGGAAPEAETEAIIDAFAARGLRVIGTHFGRVEDLRTDNTTNANTDQLGYTDAAIGLHSDQPFLERPPRYQLLQCIRPADEGGENEIADARAAAEHLAAVDADAHEALARTPIVFHRRQRAFERAHAAPVLESTPEGFRVRFSYFTMAPHRLPFERVEGYYRAYDRFARLVRARAVRLALGAGDFLLYDNWRMLHARTAFRGARWVRGVYFDAPPHGPARESPG
ncbi:MAG TPA: TauD/TfdA family dioxygenase [Polyangiaceae bacterium]|nr:TauD/TfdA family dioxygenase [Polyangiaceae bacterium]